jgi:hypothetical protein
MLFKQRPSSKDISSLSPEYLTYVLDELKKNQKLQRQIMPFIFLIVAVFLFIGYYFSLNISQMEMSNEQVVKGLEKVISPETKKEVLSQLPSTPILIQPEPSFWDKYGTAVIVTTLIIFVSAIGIRSNALASQEALGNQVDQNAAAVTDNVVVAFQEAQNLAINNVRDENLGVIQSSVRAAEIDLQRNVARVNNIDILQNTNLDVPVNPFPPMPPAVVPSILEANICPDILVTILYFF